jgi:hypothetical protein
MHDEDTLLRSTRGIAYLAIAPCVFLSAAVWFTSDSIGIVIANLFQVYFSILLLLLFGYIWSLKSNFGEQYKSQLEIMAIMPILLALSGIILNIFTNPAWGIGFLMMGFYLSRFVRFYFSVFKIISKTYIDLLNRISIILCICLMLIFTYWLNPYSNPLETYI